MPRYEHVERIAAPPAAVFAVIDDLPRTADWLPPCVSLAKVEAGPNAAGDKLRYVFKQGSQQGEMAGEIVDRVPDRLLHCRYADAQFEVSVEMRLEPDGADTVSTHAIEITPKTLGGRLLSPLIKLGLRSQTRTAAGNLRKLVEAAGR